MKEFFHNNSKTMGPYHTNSYSELRSCHANTEFKKVKLEKNPTEA
jgi:hypothetical protein